MVKKDTLFDSMVGNTCTVLSSCSVICSFEGTKWVWSDCAPYSGGEPTGSRLSVMILSGCDKGLDSYQRLIRFVSLSYLFFCALREVVSPFGKLFEGKKNEKCTFLNISEKKL